MDEVYDIAWISLDGLLSAAGWRDIREARKKEKKRTVATNGVPEMA